MPDEIPPVENTPPIQPAPAPAPVPPVEQTPPPAAKLVIDGIKSERELQLETDLAAAALKAENAEKQLRDVQALQITDKKKIKRSFLPPVLIGSDEDETE